MKIKSDISKRVLAPIIALGAMTRLWKANETAPPGQRAEGVPPGPTSAERGEIAFKALEGRTSHRPATVERTAEDGTSLGDLTRRVCALEIKEAQKSSPKPVDALLPEKPTAPVLLKGSFCGVSFDYEKTEDAEGSIRVVFPFLVRAPAELRKLYENGTCGDLVLGEERMKAIIDFFPVAHRATEHVNFRRLVTNDLQSSTGRLGESLSKLGEQLKVEVTNMPKGAKDSAAETRGPEVSHVTNATFGGERLAIAGSPSDLWPDRHGYLKARVVGDVSPVLLDMFNRQDEAPLCISSNPDLMARIHRWDASTVEFHDAKRDKVVTLFFVCKPIPAEPKEKKATDDSNDLLVTPKDLYQCFGDVRLRRIFGDEDGKLDLGSGGEVFRICEEATALVRDLVRAQQSPWRVGYYDNDKRDLQVAIDWMTSNGSAILPSRITLRKLGRDAAMGMVAVRAPSLTNIDGFSVLETVREEIAALF